METKSEKCEKEQALMEKVALSFQKAMKGIGTDEARIIREVAAYNNTQRQLIKSKYLVLTGKEIEEDLKSEISGYFLEAVLALFTPPDEYEASILKKAFEGVGTDEQKIIEILCTKNAEEIRELNKAYKRIYNTELDADLKSEVSGDLGRLFRSLASGNRRENHGFDQDFIEEEAQKLYDAGEGKIGTDEKEFIRILCSRSFAELNAIFEFYRENFENDLEKAIKGEFSGDLREALLTIVKCIHNKQKYFAEFIHTSAKKKSNFERDLLQVVIRRAEIDLSEINDEYVAMYNKSLADLVEKKTSGDFKKLMLSLLKNV